MLRSPRDANTELFFNCFIVTHFKAESQVKSTTVGIPVSEIQGNSTESKEVVQTGYEFAL